jgi:hypothetical protein
MSVHSPFGGSVAARVLHCPASVRLVEKVPAHLRRSSTYADRGTACHAAITMLLDGHSLASLVGKTIGDYAITRDDVEEALRPAYAYATQLLDVPGAEFYLEHRITFPTIAGAYGTADLLIRIGNTIHVIDFKFGVGVRVLALYPDRDEDVINSQLIYYAAAARHSLRDFFAGVESIILTIVQPQSTEVDAEMVSSVAVTHGELDAFTEVYCDACAQALGPDPRLERGDWCRFCPAKPICPKHTGPLLDFAQLSMLAASAAPNKQAYLQALADGLNLVDAIKDLRVALHDQAKAALEHGDSVPGYGLTAGRAERHWRDESAALAALQELGLERDDIIAEAMRSPKQLELRAKARGLKIPQELISSRRSGTSLVRSENVRVPMRGQDELARLFTAALKACMEAGDDER